MLDRYLAEGRSDHRPPRFFLNDVMRYWRTIAVDFAGKHREDERKWGLRNAKLRTSRKMLFAGGLVPILRCHALRGADVRPFLAAAAGAAGQRSRRRRLPERRPGRRRRPLPRRL